MARKKKSTVSPRTIQSNWNYGFIMMLWLKKHHNPKSRKVQDVKTALLNCTVAHPGLFLNADHFLGRRRSKVFEAPAATLADAEQDAKAEGYVEVWN